MCCCVPVIAIVHGYVTGIYFVIYVLNVTM